MATTKPRVNMVLEAEDYERLGMLARANRTSMSEQARRFLLEMMEIREDAALASLAAARRKTRARPLSHESVWRKASRSASKPGR